IIGEPHLVPFKSHAIEEKAVQRKLMAFSVRKRGKVQFPRSRILNQKQARLYIIHRCVLMLIYWRDPKDK
ncbi:hypothetical protein E1A91_A11G109200v1, partial [Gossypium mustelinum]